MTSSVLLSEKKSIGSTGTVQHMRIQQALRHLAVVTLIALRWLTGKATTDAPAFGLQSAGGHGPLSVIAAAIANPCAFYDWHRSVWQ